VGGPPGASSFGIGKRAIPSCARRVNERVVVCPSQEKLDQLSGKALSVESESDFTCPEPFAGVPITVRPDSSHSSVAR